MYWERPRAPKPLELLLENGIHCMRIMYLNCTRGYVHPMCEEFFW